MQHAREWLAGETCRRTLDFFVDNYGQTGTRSTTTATRSRTCSAETVTALVDTRELWFVCVSNPDGYEFTFTPGNRLWRKNMRDNDNDGQCGRWATASTRTATSRRTGASTRRARPTTPPPRPIAARARTPSPRRRRSRACRTGSTSPSRRTTTRRPSCCCGRTASSSTRRRPTTRSSRRSPATTPSRRSPTRRSTRTTRCGTSPATGSTRTCRRSSTSRTATRSTTPTASTARSASRPRARSRTIAGVSGFEFQDDEDDIEAEFRRHLLFALDLAESAADPGNPVSHMGNTVADFYVDTFKQSWGDPQTVQATVKRSLGAVVMRYRVNGGAIQTVPTSDWLGGERYGKDPGRRTTTGCAAWSRAPRPATTCRCGSPRRTDTERSAAFTYRAAKESGEPGADHGRRELHRPDTRPGSDGPEVPVVLHVRARRRTTSRYDVYDVDARTRRRPDWLGVLSHYKAVVWYTGDDYVTRRPGQPGGTGTARFNLDEEIDARDYMNEGGKLFFTGQNAGRQWAEGYEVRNYGFPEPPEGGKWCSGDEAGVRQGRPVARRRLHRAQQRLPPVLPGGVRVRAGRAVDRPGRERAVRMAGSGPLDGLSWKLRRHRRRQPGELGDLPGHEHDPRPGPLPDVRELAQHRQLAAAGRGAVRSVHAARSTRRGRGRRVVQAAPPGPSTSRGKTAGELTFKTSYDLEERLRLHVRGGRRARRCRRRPDRRARGPRCPDVNGHTRRHGA